MSGIRMTGFVAGVLWTPSTGRVKAIRSGGNMVVDGGLDLLAVLMDPNSTNVYPTSVAVGTSDATPEGVQTSLQGTELDRVDLGSTSVVEGNKVEFNASFAGDFTGTIEEAGLFTASTGGTMVSRFLTGTFDKDANDQFDLRWQLTVTR